MGDVTYPPPPQQPDPYGPRQGQPHPPQQGYAPPQYGQPQYAPQPPKKKGGAGKVLLIVGAVVVLLCGGGILIAALAAGGSHSSGTSGGGNSDTPGGGTAKHAGLNQPARDGKFEFTVSKVQCGVPTVGDPAILGKTAQGQFCLVTTRVVNISSQPQTFDGGDQKAHDAAGTTFANDGTAELYANKETQTFLDQINPGNSVVGTLVFDIPKTAVIKTLELHDSPFSGGVIVTVA